MQLPGLEPFDSTLDHQLTRGLEARGPGHRPRTHHLAEDGSPLYVNRLIHETSPYLLQHAHNPVSWHPWGEEAFAEAKRRDAPVLLSVGYSTCHWCHVMERESFEDAAIAELINRHYVAIKVDREERPDVDGIYMTAVQLLTGQGGWPMTVVLTPDRVPFFGGTYFPPRDGARIGFATLLQRLATGYQQDRPSVLRASVELSRAMVEASTPQPAEGVPSIEVVAAAATALARRFDRERGGFGSAPKFPRPVALTLLLRFGLQSKAPDAIEMVRYSLQRMAAGGIHDQIGGGFHRYSTDADWLVPHFEKMTYDNAQLIAALVETWQATRDANLRATAERTLDYVEREMTDPAGGFWSATDADSEGHEGIFFSWTDGDLAAALDPGTAIVVRAYYAVRPGGNFEGRHILHRPSPDQDVARSLGMPLVALRQTIARANAALYAARKRKIPPILDDKIITEWNGLMIGAFARAGMVFGQPGRIEAAKRAARFVLATCRTSDRRLTRTSAAKHPAVLEDHTALIAGLLDLVEATGEAEWMTAALEIQALQDRYYLDAQNGSYFTAASDVSDLMVREKPVHDGATPAGSSVAAMNLMRLAELTGESRFRDLAERTIAAVGSVLTSSPLSAPLLVAAVEQMHSAPPVVIIVGDGEELYRRAVEVHIGAGMVVMVAEGSELARGKVAKDGRPTAYVCRRGLCLEPTNEAEVMLKQLT